MKFAALIYENFTQLDLVGPLEVLSLLPNAEIRIAATQRGVIWADNGVLPVIAPFDVDDIETADVLLIPGGTGTVAALEDARLVDAVRRIDKGTRWTTSVCTGSLLLGAAGLLAGRKATTHWAMMEALGEQGADPVSQRWVEDGKFITAAGVSAGIDMALYLAAKLAGDDTAKAIQLAIEYDPAPPFTAGSPASAGPEVITAVAGGQTALNTRSERPRPDLGFLQR